MKLTPAFVIQGIVALLYLPFYILGGLLMVVGEVLMNIGDYINP